MKHKFNAQPVQLDGIKFASKREGKRYQSLKMLQEAGIVLFFLRQTPFHLPGGTKYVSDFLVFWSDGNVTVEDCKGFKTALYKAKKQMVEHLYPIKIQEF